MTQIPNNVTRRHLLSADDYQVITEAVITIYPEMELRTREEAGTMIAPASLPVWQKLQDEVTAKLGGHWREVREAMVDHLAKMFAADVQVKSSQTALEAITEGINACDDQAKIDELGQKGETTAALMIEGMNKQDALRGRPTGSTKEGGRKKTHGITIEEDVWAKAQATGNASAYIERLITEDAG